MALLVAGLLAVRVGGPQEHRADRISPVADSVYRLGATKWRLATFNLLGSGHTEGSNPDKPGYATGEVRMGYSLKIIQREGLSLVGFQEMRLDQYDEFNRLTGAGWDLWPGRPDQTGHWAERHIANSIGWRTDTWTVVRRDVEPIRYVNDDAPVNFPVVWLRHKLTGQLVIHANFHNVADVWDDEIEGGAAARRAEEIAAQINLANELRADFPGVPVFFTGDFNAREEAFCPIVDKTALWAANGGWASSTRCHPPAKPLPIDWIFGSAPATFSGWRKLWDGDSLVQKATDHPVIVSQVAVPPASARDAGIDHVVLLSLEGVRTKTVADLGAKATGLAWLRKYAASTYNAQPVERPTSLSNVASMLTGKPINTDISGHGVHDGTRASTVHDTAGRYVSSVMDVLHDRGLRTALFTNDPGAAIFDRSWNSTNGAADVTWTDNGRDKISTFSHNANAATVAAQVTKSLTASSPATFTYGQLSRADQVGHAYGFDSAEYRTAVVQVATQVWRVIQAIEDNPALRGRTLLVVAGEHGAYGSGHTSPDRLDNMRVPLYVRGPGVPRGVGLYTLNPDYTDPGTRIAGYQGGQPIRPAMVPNLVTAVLSLPAVPGSTMNTQQNFTVFGTP